MGRSAALATFFAAVFAVGCTVNSSEEEVARDPAQARRHMVQEQIRGRGVRDPRVLAAMEKVPRHELVPADVRDAAYEDRPLPIGLGQTISQPYVVAAMTEALRLEGHEKVLEVGTGSGYQAAVLAELCREVFTIELEGALAARARADLERLGVRNVSVRHGNGYRGWPEQAPFDAIVVTAAPDHIPSALVDQLALGGRMVIPVGRAFQELLLVTRTEDGIQREFLMGVRFVPMREEIDTEDAPPAPTGGGD
ncbi:MAG TPA: protein-L-isoaspartate(D-aspartate) O-methyltransferase [Myxococcota bacterium]